jgi:2-haloacid dehalogenase
MLLKVYFMIMYRQKHFDMTTVWIDRQNLNNGGNWGATKVVDNLPKPDVIFKDLISFAEETAKN